MKAKHVFTTLGLALAMGLGVAAGLSHVREFKQAKAEMQSWYVVGSFDGEGKWNASSGYAMTEESTNVWVKRALKFKVNDAFKVCDEETKNWQGGWSYNNGDSDPKTYFKATADDANIVCQTEGYYDITFTKADYHIKVDKLATFTVHVYIDGVAQADQEVASGALPTVPAHYGKSFSGWFSDAACTKGNEVTSITGATTVYGKMTTLPTVTYTLDQSLGEVGKFAKTYLYAFDEGGHNADWPGAEITGAPKSFTIPNDAKFVINAGEGKEQTVDINQSGVANDTLYLLDTKDGDNYKYKWASDTPAQNGYYLVGSKTHFTYAGATAMSMENLEAPNCAELFDYEAEEGEAIKVRGYFAGENPEHKWSYAGDSESALGAPDGDANYVLKKNAHIDVFAKWMLQAKEHEEDPDVWELKFFVTEHAERHVASIKLVLFEGKAKRTVENGTNQRITEGVTFTPALEAKEGYVARAAYKDEACTDPFVPGQFTTDQTVYIKNTKKGAYLVGNELFAGAGLAWNIDGGQLLTVPEAGDKFKTVVTISGASVEHPVEVKGVDYQADESLDDHYLSWTIAPSSEEEHYTAPTYVHQDGNGNFAFTADGTYAMYVNQSDKVYFNVGFDAFNTMFLTEIGTVCQNDGTTNPSLLATAWTKVKAAYGNLSAEDKAKYNPGKTIDSGNESGTDQEKVIAKYKYIVVTKYAGVYEDFIWNHDYSSSNRISVAQTIANNTALVVILVATISVISAAGLFLVIRRRKHN